MGGKVPARGIEPMRTVLLRFLKDENGATVVEYALIVAVLSLTIIGGVGQVFNSLTWLFSNNTSRLANAFAQ
jgi:pilus assembly protein Flp/PilA